MNSDLKFFYHRLIFREGKNIYMTPGCKEFFNMKIECEDEISWQNLLSLLPLDNRHEIDRKVNDLSSGKVVTPVVCLSESLTGETPVELIIFLDEIIYGGQNAIQATILKNDTFIGNGNRFQRESEVMRDVLAALAGADNLQKALEVILLNLHDIIQYDRAGLILADEDKRFVITQKEGKNDGEISRRFLDEDPIVKEIISKKRVQIVTDVQLDRRFDNWLDMDAVHGWLAAPLIVQNEVIGILTLGSLQMAAYSKEDAELMRIFAGQIAQVLEKAWAREQRTSRNKELEIISSISLALGKAESRENTS